MGSNRCEPGAVGDVCGPGAARLCLLQEKQVSTLPGEFPRTSKIMLTISTPLEVLSPRIDLAHRRLCENTHQCWSKFVCVGVTFELLCSLRENVLYMKTPDSVVFLHK